MPLLLVIAFAAGLITAFTPCILPVLPILLAGGSAGGKRRPYAIVAGLVASFTVFTLAATAILRALNLRDDRLNQIAFVMLLLLSLTLIFPQVGRWIERPFYFLTRRRAADVGGGFLLGASLGLVFVPCAGPVFGAVSSLAGREEVTVNAVFITLAYALGAALPMLLIAYGGRELAGRLKAHARSFRVAMGVLMAVTAVGLYQGWFTDLQTKVPEYARALQRLIEENDAAERELAKLRGDEVAGDSSSPELASASMLPDYGPAPEFAEISSWLNSPALTIAGLRGKVVLIDFWTYSCINCIRTLPHLRSWHETYKDRGLQIVGVHTPEFAFERVRSNVQENAERLDVRWPIALDNEYGTWDAYANRYWPAKYLIDREGHVRYAHFGEGRYEETELVIRRLLGVERAPRTRVADRTPTGPQTPETYLGYLRLGEYRGTPEQVVRNREASYSVPVALDPNTFAFGGRWTVRPEHSQAGRDARLAFRIQAQKVFLVLTGKGRVRVSVDDKPHRTVRVNGNRLYTLAVLPRHRTALLDLRFTPGLRAFAFTFG